MSIVLVTGVPGVGKTTYLNNKPYIHKILFDDYVRIRFKTDSLVIAGDKFANNIKEEQQLWYENILMYYKNIGYQQLYVEDCLVTVKERLQFYEAFSGIPFALLWIDTIHTMDTIKDRILHTGNDIVWQSARIEMLLRAEPPTTFEQEKYPVFTIKV